MQKLDGRYDLDRLLASCGPVELDESLYVLDLLDTLGLAGDGASGRGLDVGSKNGAYLAGLALAWRGGWDAVEIDAHRRYLSLHTRRAFGEAAAARWEGCRFHAADVRSLSGSWARITWLLPFLTATPHRAWGLSADLLDPPGLLRDVLGKLAPEGLLLIVNQGREEHARQGALLEAHRERFVAEDLGVLAPPLSPFRRERLGWRVTPRAR
jgi:hypothetical protein